MQHDMYIDDPVVPLNYSSGGEAGTDLEGQGGDNGLGVHQAGVAEVVEAIFSEDLCPKSRKSCTFSLLLFPSTLNHPGHTIPGEFSTIPLTYTISFPFFTAPHLCAPGLRP